MRKLILLFVLFGVTSSHAAIERKPMDPSDIADRKAIREIVMKHRTELRYCYAQATKKDPKLRGQLLLKWEIKPHGRVGKIRVEKSSMKNAPIERCIASRVKNWRFPARGDVGTRKVTFPFVFNQKLSSEDLKKTVPAVN